jgi:hypothetical protein
MIRFMFDQHDHLVQLPPAEHAAHSPLEEPGGINVAAVKPER